MPLYPLRRNAGIHSSVVSVVALSGVDDLLNCMNPKPVQLVPEAMWPNHVAEADFAVAS